MMRRSLCIYHMILKGGLNNSRVNAIRGICEGVIRNSTVSSPEQDWSPESWQEKRGVGTHRRVCKGVPHEDDGFIRGLRHSAGAGMSVEKTILLLIIPLVLFE